MSLSLGFWDSMFGEKITIELPDENGGVFKRQVTKKWLEKMLSEGKISTPVTVNILNAITGKREEEWMVNEQINYQTYKTFTKSDDVLFILESYDDDGKLNSTIVKRDLYLNAIDKFLTIDTENENAVAAALDLLHQQVGLEVCEKVDAARQEVRSQEHGENSLRARWLKRIEVLTKGYQQEAVNRSHSLHNDFNEMIILHLVLYIRIFLELLETGVKVDKSFNELDILRVEQLLNTLTEEQYRELAKYIVSILFIEFLNNDISNQLFDMGIDEDDFKNDFFYGLQIEKKFIMTETVQSLQKKVLTSLDLPVTEANLAAISGASSDTYSQFHNAFVGWVEEKYLGESGES
jgi:hypothetical protein